MVRAAPSSPKKRARSVWLCWKRGRQREKETDRPHESATSSSRDRYRMVAVQDLVRFGLVRFGLIPLDSIRRETRDKPQAHPPAYPPAYQPTSSGRKQRRRGIGVVCRVVSFVRGVPYTWMDGWMEPGSTSEDTRRRNRLGSRSTAPIIRARARNARDSRLRLRFLDIQPRFHPSVHS
mmetsp:Transcript_8539/g.16481  ORF Transcript_8539/g.16481 Transcript_8539/m.16481 type:complete len:178 (+) Transcript_8539:21-554(+)